MYNNPSGKDLSPNGHLENSSHNSLIEGYFQGKQYEDNIISNYRNNISNLENNNEKPRRRISISTHFYKIKSKVGNKTN